MPWSSNENKDLVRYSKILGGKKLRNLVLKVMPFLSSMHSCQPQQAIEPSKTEQIETTESTDESLQGGSTDDTTQKSKRKGPFATIHETTKNKISNLRRSDFWNSWDHEWLPGFIKKYPTKELIQLLREDSERPAKNHQIFLQLMQYYLLLKI